MNAEAVPTKDAARNVTATGPLRHMCPFVDEEDHGTVRVDWVTGSKSIELHSLRAYLDTFAETRISHEQLTEQIRRELNTLDGLTITTVTTSWETAGMEVRCSTSPIPAPQP